jgi:hypothetical protein
MPNPTEEAACRIASFTSIPLRSAAESSRNSGGYEGAGLVIEANNPRVISYGFFLDEDATVVAVHPDSAALEFHMDVGEAEFPPLCGPHGLSSIAVYGDVSDAVLERLTQKAQRRRLPDWRLSRAPMYFEAFVAPSWAARAPEIFEPVPAGGGWEGFLAGCSPRARSLALDS